jgi:hypothetical protein
VVEVILVSQTLAQKTQRLHHMFLDSADGNAQALGDELVAHLLEAHEDENPPGPLR